MVAWIFSLATVTYLLLTATSATVAAFTTASPKLERRARDNEPERFQVTPNKMMTTTSSDKWVRLAESTWRSAAAAHRRRLYKLLQPGMTDPNDVINSGQRRREHRRRRRRAPADDYPWTALDPKHPVYNFLIEYYGLKGAKGVRRLARWSPCPSLLLSTKGEAASGILLEGASLADDDDGHGDDLLHLRGALPHDEGLVYSPQLYFANKQGDDHATKAAIPFYWYRAVLAQTLSAEPVLHCHGLHEWAMQYQPDGAPPPPSAKYQAHLPLRVSRETINAVVERKGVQCTHVDALRYFAPAAGPLNQHGADLPRTRQLQLEQPACVHAHMDLIKQTLKLQPFVSSDLVCDAVEMALAARRLDVAASPYNASEMYGLTAVPVETAAGRAEYRAQQKQLMQQAAPLRQRVLQAYDTLLTLAFDEETQRLAATRADPERHARAQPGGLPWRKNLASSTTTTTTGS